MSDITKYTIAFASSGSITNFYSITKNTVDFIPITASSREYNEEALSEILDKQHIEIIPTQLTQSVSGILQANFYATPVQGSPPFLVSFFDTSEGNNIIDWKWTLGNGTIIDNIQFPQYTYENIGNFHISLQVTASNGQTSEITKNNYIMVSYDLPVEPVINWSVDTRIGEAPLTVVFTDETIGPVISWFWYFHNEDLPNIEITSNQQNPIIEFIEPGHYHTTLKVTWHDEQGILHETSKEEEDYIIVSPSMVVPTSLYQLNLKDGGYTELLFGKENFYTAITTGAYSITFDPDTGEPIEDIDKYLTGSFSLEMLFKYETNSDGQPNDFPLLFKSNIYANYTTDFPFKIYRNIIINNQVVEYITNPFYPGIFDAYGYIVNFAEGHSFPLTWRANRGFFVSINPEGYPYVQVNFSDWIEQDPNKQFILNDENYCNQVKVYTIFELPYRFQFRDDINWNSYPELRSLFNSVKYIDNFNYPTIKQFIESKKQDTIYENLGTNYRRVYSIRKCERNHWYYICISCNRKFYSPNSWINNPEYSRMGMIAPDIYIYVKDITTNSTITVNELQVNPNINQYTAKDMFSHYLPIGNFDSLSTVNPFHSSSYSFCRPSITGWDGPKINHIGNESFIGSVKYVRFHKDTVITPSEFSIGSIRTNNINQLNLKCTSNGMSNSYGIWNMNEGENDYLYDDSAGGLIMKLQPDPISNELPKWDSIDELLI